MSICHVLIVLTLSSSCLFHDTFNIPEQSFCLFDIIHKARPPSTNMFTTFRLSRFHSIGLIGSIITDVLYRSHSPYFTIYLPSRLVDHKPENSSSVPYHPRTWRLLPLRSIPYGPGDFPNTELLIIPPDPLYRFDYSLEYETNRSLLLSRRRKSTTSLRP